MELNHHNRIAAIAASEENGEEKHEEGKSSHAQSPTGCSNKSSSEAAGEK
ncbi:hypothetical protein LBMAG45_04330 [Nitrospirota bacterium]|nr:hypothetical protein LBMAG45_04330 [Nitrospirota bacterium]